VKKTLFSSLVIKDLVYEAKAKAKTIFSKPPRPSTKKIFKAKPRPHNYLKASIKAN